MTEWLNKKAFTAYNFFQLAGVIDKTTKIMKRTILLSIICILTLACQSASVDKNGVIKYKETVSLTDVPKATLTFFEVSDSRCPQGVQCFWAGNATVDLALDGVGTDGKITNHVKMCLGDCHTLYKSSPFREVDSLDQEFAGQKYRFILEAVNPAPKVDSTKKKGDYSITLRIEKK